MIQVPQDGQGPLVTAFEGSNEREIPQAVHQNFTGEATEGLVLERAGCTGGGVVNPSVQGIRVAT